MAACNHHAMLAYWEEKQMRLIPRCLMMAGLLGSLPAHAGLLVTPSDATLPVPAGAADLRTLTISFQNTGVASIELLVWQLGLSVIPGEGSTGTVEIQNFAAASDYFLSGLSPAGPVAPLDTLPSVSALITDAAVLSPSGGVVSAGASEKVLDVTLSISADAQGTFYLAMYPFADQFESSSWGSAPLPIPLPFDNGGLDADLAARTLTTITVTVPEPMSLALAGACLLNLLIARAFGSVQIRSYLSHPPTPPL